MQDNDLLRRSDPAGQPDTTENPFLLTCGSFAPGEADSFLASIHDKTKKAIAEAELLYYRGQAGKASAIGSALKESDDPSATAGAFLIDTVTALSLGNTEQILAMMEMMDNVKPLIEASPKIKKTVDFFLLYFNILTHNRGRLRFPEVSVNAFAVPDELMPMAIYAYAHYLILCGDYGRAIGLAEGMLIQMKQHMPISEIYLSVIVSVGYICRSEWNKAEYYFRHAWELSQPDGICMPFAEHKGMLSGMLERCVRREQPEAYKKISSLFNAYHKNWVKVHNSLTGESVTDKLTGTELNVAMLASKGLSNTEIGEFLCISVNSVRSHLRNIFNKLEISNRKELNQYVIK